MRFRTYPNRYICTVLDEMRKCNETRNYAPLLSLIEEAQILANRMESGLEDLEDLEYARRERKKLKKEIDKLEKKKEELEDSTQN